MPATTSVDTIAPATPEWTVRDLLAHLDRRDRRHRAGQPRRRGYRRVGRAAGRRLVATAASKQLLAEWNEHGPVIESMADQFGPAAGRLMSDDGRPTNTTFAGALGVPGTRDSDAVALSFRFVGESLGVELEDGGTGALEVQHGDAPDDLRSAVHRSRRSARHRSSSCGP